MTLHHHQHTGPKRSERTQNHRSPPDQSAHGLTPDGLGGEVDEGDYAVGGDCHMDGVVDGLGEA